MSESTRPRDEPSSRVRELSTAAINFDVVDRNGELIGRVRDINLGRTCFFVEAGRGRPFGRKPRHAVHVRAVRDINAHTFKVSLAATKQDVAEAPEVGELDKASAAALARYYERVAALADADAE